MRAVILGLVVIVIFISICCDSNEPQSASTLTLSVEDVSCTEAWLQLKTANLNLPNRITLFVNELKYREYLINKSDTLLYIDSLLPNKSYSFKAISFYNAEDGVKSNKVVSTTMDTSSNNFTWQSWTFGTIGGSGIDDIAIINENDIWAVGRIYMNDSLGNPDLICYDAVHWDGNSWELIKIGGYGGYTRSSVIAFSENDVWFDGVIKWDGLSYSVHMDGWPLMPNGDGWQVNKMWGRSSNDFYAVGSYGNIAYYNGVVWKKLTSGTLLFLVDIIENKVGEVLIVGDNYSEIKGIVIKSQDGINFSTLVESEIVSGSQIFKPKLAGSLHSAWADQNNTIYVAGDFLYQYKFNKWNYITSFPHNYLGGNYYASYFGFITGISGKYSNDMWVVGDRNTVRHFNGISWQQIGTSYNPNSSTTWVDVQVKNNITAIIGSIGNQAAIMIIKR